MNDSLGVAGRQRIRHLDADVEDLIHLHRLALQPVLQAHPFQLLHDDEGMAVEVFDVVDGANAGMVQLRSGASFQHEAVQGLGVVEQAVGNELQGDVAAQAGVDRVVDHAHAATTELTDDAVVRNGLADHPQGRGFHLAVMLGCVRNPVNPRHPYHIHTS